MKLELAEEIYYLYKNLVDLRWEIAQIRADKYHAETEVDRLEKAIQRIEAKIDELK